MVGAACARTSLKKTRCSPATAATRSIVVASALAAKSSTAKKRYGSPMGVRHRRMRVLTSAFAALFLASAAHADAPNPDQTPKPERRSGLLVGGTGLFASGTAAGYPNQAAQIGDPTYYGA